MQSAKIVFNKPLIAPIRQAAPHATQWFWPKWFLEKYSLPPLMVTFATDIKPPYPAKLFVLLKKVNASVKFRAGDVALELLKVW